MAIKSMKFIVKKITIKDKFLKNPLIHRLELQNLLMEKIVKYITSQGEKVHDLK